MARPEYFFDTSYAVALTVEDDVHHARAQVISEQLERESAQLITTRAVIYEIGNSFSRLRLRSSGISLIEEIRTDSLVTIIDDTPDRFQSAFELFKKYQDKEWGLVDCLSFVVMAERQLTEALTADVHFTQAGYRALLRE
jgi:uncharacterized protein